MYAKVDNFGGHYDNGGTLTSQIDDANVITSMVKDNVTMHKVVIDLDLPAALIPSSTPGHFHLYIDHAMSADAYWTLLNALAAAGLIEENYAQASIDQGRSAVRLPWIKKETDSDLEKTLRELSVRKPILVSETIKSGHGI